MTHPASFPGNSLTLLSFFPQCNIITKVLTLSNHKSHQKLPQTEWQAPRAQQNGSQSGRLGGNTNRLCVHWDAVMEKTMWTQLPQTNRRQAVTQMWCRRHLATLCCWVMQCVFKCAGIRVSFHYLTYFQLWWLTLTLLCKVTKKLNVKICKKALRHATCLVHFPDISGICLHGNFSRQVHEVHCSLRVKSTLTAKFQLICFTLNLSVIQSHHQANGNQIAVTNLVCQTASLFKISFILFFLLCQF